MTSWPYPAPADDNGARHLVPDFELPDVPLASTAGGEVSIAGVSGWAVLFVYPWSGRPGLPDPPGWDDIPGAHGSTPEAAGFRDLHPEFCASGARVLGLSTQDPAHQHEFSARLDLPFELLSDEAGVLQNAIGLPIFLAGGVAYLKRLTLVICDGRLRTVFYPVHPPDTHAAEVLAWLRMSDLSA